MQVELSHAGQANVLLAPGTKAPKVTTPAAPPAASAAAAAPAEVAAALPTQVPEPATTSGVPPVPPVDTDAPAAAEAPAVERSSDGVASWRVVVSPNDAQAVAEGANGDVAAAAKAVEPQV